MKYPLKAQCIKDSQLISCEVLGERLFLGFLWKQYCCLYKVNIRDGGQSLYTTNRVEWIRKSNVII